MNHYCGANQWWMVCGIYICAECVPNLEKHALYEPVIRPWLEKIRGKILSQLQLPLEKTSDP